MENIISFWFPNDKFQKFWFDKSVDTYIINNYTQILKDKEQIEINKNELTIDELLQYTILFDQFSRHIYRNSNPNKNDSKALEISFYVLDNYDLRMIKFNYLIFFLMPLRHSNDKNNYELILNILDHLKLSINNNFNQLFDKFYKNTLWKYNKINL